MNNSNTYQIVVVNGDQAYVVEPAQYASQKTEVTPIQNGQPIITQYFEDRPSEKIDAYLHGNKIGRLHIDGNNTVTRLRNNSFLDDGAYIVHEGGSAEPFDLENLSKAEPSMRALELADVVYQVNQVAQAA